MGWFTRSRSSSPSGRSTRSHRSSHHTRPSSYARSHAGSSFSSSRHHSSTSHYKRRPRDGYIAYLYHKFRHLLRQLWHYAQKHPFKVFFMVIMPLVSGGVLHKLARQFGVTLPGEELTKSGARARGGYYGSEGYGDELGYGRGGNEGGFGLEQVVSGMGGLASMAKMAQAFM